MDFMTYGEILHGLEKSDNVDDVRLLYGEYKKTTDKMEVLKKQRREIDSQITAISNTARTLEEVISQPRGKRNVLDEYSFAEKLAEICLEDYKTQLNSNPKRAIDGLVRARDE